MEGGAERGRRRVRSHLDFDGARRLDFEQQSRRARPQVQRDLAVQDARAVAQRLPAQVGRLYPLGVAAAVEQSRDVGAVARDEARLP